jgi:hypothetical protein
MYINSSKLKKTKPLLDCHLRRCPNRRAELWSKFFFQKVFVLVIVATAVVSFRARGAVSQDEVSLIRRVTLFPILSAPEYAGVADDAWWQMRDEMTLNRRLLVASRQFLLKNDVFQARGRLPPADSILLGKLLDAHALITSQFDGQKLSMQAYDAGNGMILWRQELPMNAAVPISEQLAKLARRMVKDFESYLPNQGHVVMDSLIGSVVYEEAGKKVVQVDFGPRAQIEVGDTVQWVRLKYRNLNPVLQDGGLLSAFAEGTVSRISQGLAVVTVDRIHLKEKIQEHQMIRAPKEALRIENTARIRDRVRGEISRDLLVPLRDQQSEWRQENRPVATTLSIVASVAAFLLLAF